MNSFLLVIRPECAMKGRNSKYITRAVWAKIGGRAWNFPFGRDYFWFHATSAFHGLLSAV